MSLGPYAANIQISWKKCYMKNFSMLHEEMLHEEMLQFHSEKLELACSQ